MGQIEDCVLRCVLRNPFVEGPVRGQFIAMLPVRWDADHKHENELSIIDIGRYAYRGNEKNVTVIGRRLRI